MNVPATTGRNLRCLPRLLLLGLAIGLPLLAGATVRRIGIRHGGPDLVWHPDVSKQLQVAKMHHGDGLDIRSLFRDDTELTLYPYGASIIASLAIDAAEFFTGRDLQTSSVWQWAYRMRIVYSALFLSATAALLLALSGRIGLVDTAMAGFLLVLEPLSAQMSHYAMNDVPMTALLLLALMAAARIPSEPARRPGWSALSGLLLGVAFGVKYQAAIGGVFVLAAWALAWPRKRANGTLLSACVLGAAGLMGVVATSPMLVQDPGYFVAKFPDFMSWQAHITATELPMAEKVFRNGRHLLALFATNGAWIPIALAGSAAVAARGDRMDAGLRCIVIGGAGFAAVLFVALVFSRDYVRANDLIPALAIAAVLTGIGCAHTERRALRLPLRALALAGVVWFGATSFLDSRALARQDTRILARDWATQHLPPGSVVRREQYTLPADRHDVIDRQHRNFTEPDAQAVIREGSYDYLITSSLAHDRIFDEYLPHLSKEGRAMYTWISEHSDVVTEFRDRPLLHAQPTIVVYRKRAGEQASGRGVP
ncbi:MAG: phospholipid carrier-dependent glycosyltransferase [bacterium]